jgi:hypothetical protein
MENNAGKRLGILSSSEVNELYSLPKFSNEHRSFNFSLDDLEKKEMESLKSIESRLDFILQLAYFKNRSMFFKIEFSESPENINYLRQDYFNTSKKLKNSAPQKTQSENQLRILKLLNFSLFDQRAKEMLEDQALQAIKVFADPRYIFDKLIDSLEKSRISIPGYSTLQKIVGMAFKKENERLNAVISENIPKYIDDELTDLLEVEDQIYGITVLKKDANGFNYKEIIREIKKKTTCNKLFKFANKIIGKLGISEQNIRYYASLVDYYTVNKLNELSYEDVRLYLICYIFYRFQKINDNLVTSFIYHTSDYQKKAEAEAKKGIQQHNTTEDDQSYDEKIGKLVLLYVDESIPNEETFGSVRAKAFKISPKDEIQKLVDHIEGKKCDGTQLKWDHYYKMSRSFL